MKIKNKLLAWLALWASVLIAFAAIATPVWLIRPFAPQTERDLNVSFWLKSWAPVITGAAAIVSLLIIAWLWRRSQRFLTKTVLIVPLGLILICAWFAGQNHFEWIFNPLAESAYAKTGETDFVDDNDLVLAIKINNESVAYPIRQLAYHHIVQDVVGGAPITATY